MKAITLLLLGTLLAGVIRCENDSNATVNSLLDGTQWKLAGWTLSSMDPADFTITAKFAGGRISGNSAVNTYSGTYTLGPGDAFSVGPLAVTEMGGSRWALGAENAYLTLLRQAKSHKMGEGRLTLYDKGGNESLIFETESSEDENRDTIAFTGTVSYKIIESGFFAIDADNGQGYEPINLPNDYAVNGLRVRVSARVRDDMASINMYGIIIEIIEISRL